MHRRFSRDRDDGSIARPSQRVGLVQRRHFDRRVRELGGELPHGVFLAMGEEGAPGPGLPVPRQQLGLVGMGGKAVDGVNAGFDQDL